MKGEIIERIEKYKSESVKWIKCKNGTYRYYHMPDNSWIRVSLEKYMYIKLRNT